MPTQKKLVTLKKKSSESSTPSKKRYTLEEFASLKPKDMDKFKDLHGYIKDILESIREELSSRIIWASNGFKPKGDEHDWRTRKNPKFMENFTSDDRDKLSINCELNKITSSNYKTIYSTVMKKIETISDNDINDTIVDIINQLISKSVNQPTFICGNVKFLVLMNSDKNIPVETFESTLTQFYKQFNDLLTSSEENIQNDLTSFTRDVSNYVNLGKLFQELLNNSLWDFEDYYKGLLSLFEKTMVMVEWNSDKNAIDKNISLISGLLTNITDIIKQTLGTSRYRTLEANIRMLMNKQGLDRKLKFKLMDIVDTLS